jgi:two-component sensor histidine kinase
MQLSAALSNHARPAGADDGSVEQLLLAFEELASNALRHGRPAVRVAVTTAGTGWLLEVSDAAVDLPPTPAVGRDAALGGLGLYLAARICATYGWDADDQRGSARDGTAAPTASVVLREASRRRPAFRSGAL